VSKPRTISVIVIQNVIDTFKRLGGTVDINEIMADYDLTPEVLNDETARIPIEVYYRASVRRLEELDDPIIGLKLGQHMNPREMPWYKDLFLAARTVAEALEISGRYYHIYNEDYEFDFELGEIESKVIIRQVTEEVASYHHMDAALINMYHYAKSLGGEGYTKLHLKHACPKGFESVYADAYDIPVLFEQEEYAFFLNNSWLTRELTSFDDPTCERLGLAERMLAESTDSQLLADQIRFILSKTLMSGDVTIARMADALDMNVRTLQRRLKEVGIFYKDLLEETRKNLALEHLINSEYTIGEIAFLVGYNDVRHFFRAFKRWTGKRPGEYRDTLKNTSSIVS